MAIPKTRLKDKLKARHMRAVDARMCVRVATSEALR